jgi:Tfp pilus assembly protein PilO
MALAWKQDYYRYRRYFVNLGNLYQKREVIVYTGITLSCFAVAFFTMFAIKPTAKTIVTLISDIKNETEIENQLQTKIYNITEAQNIYNANLQVLGMLDEALPESPSLENFVWYLETMFLQQELVIKNIDYEPIAYMGKTVSPTANIIAPQEAVFSFKVTGNYENIKATLIKLQNLRRLVTVDSFSIAQSGPENLNNLNLSVSGKTYFLPTNK